MAERSLQDHIDSNSEFPLPEKFVSDVLLQIARGSREMAALFHRDLKPAIILYHDTRWRIADFGILGDSEFKGQADLAQALDLAKGARGKDAFGYRAEFINLVEIASLIRDLKK